MKRIAKVTLIAVLLGIVGVFTLWLGSRKSAVPEVKIYQLSQAEAEPADTGDDPFSASFDPFDGSSIPDPDPEGWNAIFQIRAPGESGLGLARDEIPVELLGPDGSWTKADLPPTLKFPDWLMLGHRTTMRMVRFSIPNGTKACRFTVRYSLPTVQERGMIFLHKLGIGRRFPKVSTWIGKRLPDREQWLEVEREVRLPSFVAESADY